VKLETVIIPKFNGFLGEIEKLYRSHVETKNVVQNLDGKMAMKLSKAELTAIQYDISQ
jgi:hypothetical protein